MQHRMRLCLQARTLASPVRLRPSQAQPSTPQMLTQAQQRLDGRRMANPPTGTVPHGHYDRTVLHGHRTVITRRGPGSTRVHIYHLLCMWAGPWRKPSGSGQQSNRIPAPHPGSHRPYSGISPRSDGSGCPSTGPWSHASLSARTVRGISVTTRGSSPQ